MQNGITLIEVIIVLAIITFLVSITSIMNLDSLRAYVFRSEVSTIVATLEKARSQAINNLNQSPYGVCFRSPNYVLFVGTSCTPAPSDKLIGANTNISVTFPTVYFEQLSGKSSTANINVSDGVRSTDIKINDEGTIIW